MICHWTSPNLITVPHQTWIASTSSTLPSENVRCLSFLAPAHHNRTSSGLRLTTPYLTVSHHILSFLITAMVCLTIFTHHAASHYYFLTANHSFLMLYPTSCLTLPYHTACIIIHHHPCRHLLGLHASANFIICFPSPSDL